MYNGYLHDMKPKKLKHYVEVLEFRLKCEEEGATKDLYRKWLKEAKEEQERRFTAKAEYCRRNNL